MERAGPTPEALQKRALVIRVAVVAVFVILWLRLWHMQVWQYELHTEISESKLQIESSVAAARGRIFDREGQALADNHATWAVVITPDRVPAYEPWTSGIEAMEPIATELERIFAGALSADEILEKATAGLPTDSFRPRLIIDGVSEETQCRIKELGPEL